MSKRQILWHVAGSDNWFEFLPGSNTKVGINRSSRDLNLKQVQYEKHGISDDGM